MKPRDGTWEENGLCADFRFVRRHKSGGPMVLVETVAGAAWVNESKLRLDSASPPHSGPKTAAPHQPVSP